MAYLIAPAARARCPYCNRREQLCRCRIVEGGHEATVALFGSDAHMNKSISEIQRLLGEVAEHLRVGTSADKRRAVAKLDRIGLRARRQPVWQW
jgi:hypothetical protein